MKLYYKDDCPFSLKVKSYLSETGNGNRVQLLNCNNVEYKKALASGGGKLQYPCLQIDEEWLYESEEIIYRLKEELKIHIESPITDYITCVFEKFIKIKSKVSDMEGKLKNNSIPF